jgi:hypothetical protein
MVIHEVCHKQKLIKKSSMEMVALSDFILEGELEAERNSVRRERETEEEMLFRRK